MRSLREEEEGTAGLNHLCRCPQECNWVDVEGGKGDRMAYAWCIWEDGDVFQQGASLKAELWGGRKKDVEFDTQGTFRWRYPVASGYTGLGQREEVLELTRVA